MYVDGIILTGDYEEDIDRLKMILANVFEMKLWIKEDIKDWYGNLYIYLRKNHILLS